ncbi:MAG: hypothetical protein EHM89_10740 [Acidobacteria bacterium]|nr:MAG: hypothetical protein EHM89_10740 [Acidobacteriota bacterium]
MGKILWFPTLTALGLLATPSGLGAEGRERADSSWASEFSVTRSDLAANGRNPHFILKPGYELVLEGSDGRSTITVKDELRTIDSVETRVVETRETQGGELIEICQNYVAVSQKTNDVFCFGQDVDIYLGGRVVAHDGSWSAGTDGAKCGLKVPGRPRLHARHYQEVAPGVAMTRAEVVELGVAVMTPVGEFKNCLHTVETTPLRRGPVVHKWYAPGIGLVQRDKLMLVKYGESVETK